jgi:hypothetical protein
VLEPARGCFGFRSPQVKHVGQETLGQAVPPDDLLCGLFSPGGKGNPTARPFHKAAFYHMRQRLVQRVGREDRTDVVFSHFPPLLRNRPDALEHFLNRLFRHLFSPLSPGSQ